jgi:tRNA nucleotidyltransferase (CCA-adding enzyme)
MAHRDRTLRHARTGRFAGSLPGPAPTAPPAAPVPAPASFAAMMRLNLDAAAQHLGVADRTPAVDCPNCGTSRTRGQAHRCAALGLVPVDGPTGKVLAAIRLAGGRPLLVGGAVRDALHARLGGTAQAAPKDVDIEVFDLPSFDPLMPALTRLARVDEAGRSWGVLKLAVDGTDFDISMPRTETKDGDGHRGFAVFTDPHLGEVEAAGRRDFTINAMGYDPETGELVDPYGGAADLAAGALRHTTKRFAEDPLRVLRAAMFAARYNLTLDPATVELAASISDQFDTIAKERVWGELVKLTGKGTRISAGLDVLHATDWERHFPELAACRDVPQDPAHHAEGPVHIHLGLAADAAAAIAERDGLAEQDRHLLVLAALCHDFGKAAPGGTQIHYRDNGTVEKITSRGHAQLGRDATRAFLVRLGAPERTVRRVVALVGEHMSHASADGTPTPTAVRRLARRLDAADLTLHDWARLVEADTSGRGPSSKASPADAWLAVAARLPAGGRAAAPLLRGEDLIAAGLTPGRSFSSIISASIAAQDAGEFTDAAGARAWLARHLVGNA